MDASFFQMEVPAEVIELIFSLIDPSECIKFKRLCRRICETLSSTHFAMLSLSQFASEKPLIVSNHSWLDKLWFSWPPTFQKTYAKLFLNVTHLAWRNLEARLGRIPKCICSLKSLTCLELCHTNLLGPLPVEIGQLMNLESLTICQSPSLVSEIPAEYGNLKQLRAIALWSCRLEGSIPRELGNLANLRILNLCDNKLTGEIPPELGNLSMVEDINLAVNQLVGTIPATFSNLSNLQHLNVADNLLMGQVPKFKSIKNLLLQRNFSIDLQDEHTLHPPILCVFII